MVAFCVCECTHVHTHLYTHINVLPFLPLPHGETPCRENHDFLWLLGACRLPSTQVHTGAVGRRTRCCQCYPSYQDFPLRCDFGYAHSAVPTRCHLHSSLLPSQAPGSVAEGQDCHPLCLSRHSALLVSLALTAAVMLCACVFVDCLAPLKSPM